MHKCMSGVDSLRQRHVDFKEQYVSSVEGVRFVAVVSMERGTTALWLGAKGELGNKVDLSALVQ